MAISRIGLVVHQGRPVAVQTAETVRKWAADHGIGCTDIDVWKDHKERRSGTDELHHAGDPDLVVTLGGDGTFLRGARIAAKNNAAVLGVDLGKVGFLTEVACRERGFTQQLAVVCGGDVAIGVVALEDLLEEVIGEFDDETDPIVKAAKAESPDR